ncbi:DUF935 domain-containing protein [Castellaniella caeni]|uniref:DUF935 domain-containing protein n=1 Tax=Castellaniella caeni TaxID=266123 RepID=UPI000C9F4093|nr:DUF935 family protein [Castellaniella caeni]
MAKRKSQRPAPGPASSAAHTPEYGRTIATIADGQDVTRGYVGPLLQTTDSVLRTRGASNLAIYEQVYSDAQVKACFGQRQLAVIQCPWSVEPASDEPVDVAAADWLTAELGRIAWDRITEKMLFGVFYGYSVAEVVYEPDERTVRISDVRVRNRRRFRFDADMGLRLLTPQNMLDGIEAATPYFWSFATGADNDDEPYGQGLAHWLYWPTLFKRQDVKFWLRFLDKFGSPTALGRYDAQTTPEPERAKLLAAVDAVQNSTGIVLPKGMEIELMEAARSGAADYKALHDTMDATIARVTVGQTASSQGTPGKLGGDDLQADVRRDLIKADADLVCESFNLGPVAWLTAWNFPAAQPPRVYRQVEEPEDLVARAERDERLARIGYRPTLAYVHKTYGGEYEAYQPTAPAPSGDKSAVDAVAFAAPAAVQNADLLAAQAPLDAALDALPGAALIQALDPMLAPVIAAIRDGASADDAYERLAAAAPDMDDEALAEALARAIFVADLWGQLSAQVTTSTAQD